jgi:hypothetical protein
VEISWRLKRYRGDNRGDRGDNLLPWRSSVEIMTNAEIREMQEAARRAKVRQDQAKLVVNVQIPVAKPKQAEARPAIERVIEEEKRPISAQIIDKKKEAARRWREKNREKLAEAERARRAGK